MPGEADETIITRLIVETDEAMRKMEEIREMVDSLKLEMQALAKEGKQPLQDAAKAMKELAEAGKKAQQSIIAKEKAKFIGDRDAEKIKNAQEKLKEYENVLKRLPQAFQEARKEESLYSKQQAKAITEISAKRKQSLKTEQDALRQMKAAQAEYTRITKQGYGVMSSQAQQYGQQIQKTAQIIQRTAQRTGQSWNQVGQRMARLGVPIQQINTALQQLNTQTQQSATGLRGMVSNIGNLGTIAKGVFGGIIGFGAVQAVQRLTRAFLDLAKTILNAAKEISQTKFAFEVAVRGLQRVGIDTTIAEWNEVIDEMKSKFPLFTRKDITDATTLAALMTREFGFTAEQIQDVINLSTTLSIITGKTLTEAVRGATYAIGAGYFEALQRVGINISRAIISQEALKRGYEGGYNAIDQTTRAAITLEVIMNGLVAVEEDAALISETFAGQVQVLNAHLKDLQYYLGEIAASNFVDAMKSVNEVIGDIVDIVEDLRNIQVSLSREGEDRPSILDTIAYIIFGARGEEAVPAAMTWIKVITNVLDALAGPIARLVGISEGLGDVIDVVPPLTIRVGEAEFTEEEYAELIKITQQYYDEVAEITEEGEEKRLDLVEDYLDDLAELREKNQERLLDLERDYYRKLEDIGLKAAQKVADAQDDYARRVAEEERKAAYRREEAERRYREREYNAERRFQERMRQLREGFLMDLEDAVRERDALQIIRLIRQYNLRRNQMIREEDIAKDERRRAFEEELRQIEYQRQERLRQLYLEHQQRLAEIQLQAEREREQAERDYQRRIAEENRRYSERVQKRREQQDEQLEELEEDIQDRVNKVLEGLEEEHNLSAEKLEAIAKLYEQTYGPNSRIDRALYWFLQRLAQVQEMMNRFRAMKMAGMTFIPPGFMQDYDDAGPQAEGGAIIARRPTVAVFGEAGAELATFTPLNKLESPTAPLAGQMPDKTPTEGRLRLEMLLSPDLEAKIVDDTLGEVADVIYVLERERA